MTRMSTAHRLHLYTCLCHSLNPALTQAQTLDLQANFAALTDEDRARLVHMADKAGLLPALHLALGRLDLRGGFAAPALGALDAAFQLNRARNQRLIQEARALSQWLALQGCPTVYLKGMAMILGGSHDIGARLTTDLDVLVPGHLMADAAAHLETRGFRIPEDKAKHRAILAHHWPPLQRKGHLARVELHDTVIVDDPDFPCAAKILRTARTMPDYPAMLVPDANISAQITLAHSALRHRAHPGHGLHLRDLWDVVTMAAAGEIDLQVVQAGFDEAGKGRACGRVLAMAETLFGVDLEALGARPLSRADRRVAARDLWRWLSPGWAGWVSHAVRKTPPLRMIVDWRRRPAYRAHLRALISDAGYRALWSRHRRLRWPRDGRHV